MRYNAAINSLKSEKIFNNVCKILPSHKAKNSYVNDTFNQVPDVRVNKDNVNPTNHFSNNEDYIYK